MRSVLEKLETVSLSMDGAGVTAERQAALVLPLPA